MKKACGRLPWTRAREAKSQEEGQTTSLAVRPGEVKGWRALEAAPNQVGRVVF